MVFAFSSAEMTAYLFQEDGETPDGTPEAPASPISASDYNVSPSQLDHDLSGFQKLGTVPSVPCDDIQTERANALECVILGSNAEAEDPYLTEGNSFRAMSEGKILDVAEKISVMGRSSPNDKFLLVQALRKREHVVAVTGDGTNDAPALHEIAQWGRSVYANIQKFIEFQLTINVAALVINVVAAVSSCDVLLTAMQFLWMNLIMDALNALAPVTEESPTNHHIDRLSIGCREPVITNIMWRNVLIQVILVMFIAKLTTTVRLRWQLWLVSIAIGFISWPLVAIGKLIQYFTNFSAPCTSQPSKEGGNDDED